MKLSQINPLAARGIVADVEVSPYRSGEFYRRAEGFPEVTVEVLVEAAPSQRNWMREAKRTKARQHRNARRLLARAVREDERLTPRLSERQRRLVARLHDATAT